MTASGVWDFERSIVRKDSFSNGGTTGIGFATAHRFLAEGARVAITGQDAKRLAIASDALGPNVLAIHSDAGNIADIDTLAGQIEGSFGALDILFLNAGVAPYGDLPAVTEAVFDAVFAVNVKGPLFAAQRFSPIIRNGGSVMVTTSVNARLGMAKTHVYAASKAAVGALVRTLANELAHRKIRVNALCPGPVITEIGGKTGLNEEEGIALAERILTKVPLNRFAQADELAATALFLASDDSTFVTGQEIVADGGWTGVGG